MCHVVVVDGDLAAKSLYERRRPRIYGHINDAERLALCVGPDEPYSLRLYELERCETVSRIGTDELPVSRAHNLVLDGELEPLWNKHLAVPGPGAIRDPDLNRLGESQAEVVMRNPCRALLDDSVAIRQPRHTPAKTLT